MPGCDHIERGRTVNSGRAEQQHNMDRNNLPILRSYFLTLRAGRSAKSARKDCFSQHGCLPLPRVLLAITCFAACWLSQANDSQVRLQPLPGTIDAASLAGSDIGAPAVLGETKNREGVIEITAGGLGVGFRSDQFHFAAASQNADFDVCVRVSTLKNTDLWAKAGIMLREGLAVDAPFAAVFTTPSGAGCLFQSRDSAGSSAANQGAFPANQPFTWLRLRREGESLTGYAGFDGRRWTVLGTKTLLLGANTFLGLAVTSHSLNPTKAEFRDLSASVDSVVARVPVPLEPLGPSTRRSSLVITEIMYNPSDRADGKELEFVELYNSQPYFEDISGWKLAGDIEFKFPAGTVIPGGGFLVVAASPDDVRVIYGLDRVLGPFSGRLSNGGGNLRLVGDHNAVFLDIEFNDSAPWPELADGTGHSLVLARPSHGEDNPRAWAASRIRGGSPGAPEAIEITGSTGVRINECQLPDATGAGFIELFNSSPFEADLGGLRLGRSPDSFAFTIPAGSKIAHGGFVRFTWAELGFSLRATGDTLYLGNADGSRFLDAVTFGPQLPGGSAGRWPNGGESVGPLPRPTPGAANTRPHSDIVINEIHHSPISGASDEEFVELFNAGSTVVDLSFWELTSGVSFAFPFGTSIPSGGYLVVARNAARLKQLYPRLKPEQAIGDFSGKLTGRGERLSLSRPITVRNASGKNETVLTTVTEAAYTGAGRWGKWSDAGGSTLELTDARAHAGLSSSWADSEESGRGGWTTVEFTGVLDNGPTGGGGGGRGGGGGGGGTLSPDSLHIILLGEGECLIDNIEVIGPGGTNRIANSTFEEGTAGWVFSGNHIRTSLESTEGDSSGQSLHLRASNNGDTGANKIYSKLTAALAANQTATLRARVKWVRGWPEILLRVRGNFIEAYGRLDASIAPGTPGSRNSRAVDNTGPAIESVTHFPVLPAVDEPVVVSALLDDPDGVSAATLRYHVDSETTQTSVAMLDDGQGGDAVPGDGVFSATIPAPGSAKLIAFTVEANDATGAGSVFPPGAPVSECLVRFGEGVQSGAFGAYRLWVTEKNANAWRDRPVLSNEPIESTFVYGDTRVVHNAGGRFAGSPYHQQFRDGPASDAHFTIELPKDDRVLGSAGFNKLHAPGNSAFDDDTIQREQAVYWMARKSGMPWLHRRYIHFYVNGTKRRTLMEDTQVGSDDFVEQFWPDDTEGDLFKMHPWFEFADATTQSLQRQNSTFVFIDRFTTTGGELKLARYRWNWLVRGADGTANNYTNVLKLINTATDYTNPDYASNVESLVDVDEWLRFCAINHAVGNWDSVGYRNSQNTYSYKPRNGRWELVIWDANIVLGNSGSDGPANLPLFTTGDPTLSRWFAASSPFRRRYLAAFYNLINGPFQSSVIAPMLDAKYAAFQEHGVTAASPGVIKTWISSARAYILSQIGNDSAPFSVTGVEGQGPFSVRGTGPLDMVALRINDSLVPVTWNSTTSWTAIYPPATSADRLSIAALNQNGQLISGAQMEVALNSPGVLAVQVSGNELVFRYSAPRAGSYHLQGTESFSNPSWQTLLSQNAADGSVDFRILIPVESNKFYRVVNP